MSFHVPEAHRILNGPWGTAPDSGPCGAFAFPTEPPGHVLLVVASVVASLEKLDVYLMDGTQTLTPTPDQVRWVQVQFWDPGDGALLLAPSDAQSRTPQGMTRHVWRPVGPARREDAADG